jgi:spore germination protein YaaH
MNKKKYIILLALFVSAIIVMLVSGYASAGYEPIEFREVWGYMMRGEEKKFSVDAPVTDICYFSVGINYKGNLTTAAKPPSIPDYKGHKRRIHLVVANLDNPALMHFCLDPRYGIRDRLVAGIVAYSMNYDGVQIDFEAVQPADRDSFIGFLRLLKAGLPAGKVLSVALPARRKKVTDAYDYGVISGIADRIMVMAYDEHWSKSQPGPVASLEWCRAVARFSRNNVPRGKLIMGLPLYGRSWQKNGYSRAVRSGEIEKILSRADAKFEYSVETGWVVTCDEKVAVVLYFDDVTATREKLMMYRNYTDSVAFWRLGMEKRELWENISIENSGRR